MIFKKSAYVLCLLPLLALGLMSLFRVPLLNQSLPLVAAMNPDWAGVAFYWAGRMILFAIFGLLLFKLVPQKSIAPTIVTAPKLAHRHDPLLIIRAMAFGLVFLGHWVDVVFRSPALEACVRDHPFCWLLTSSPWAGLWIFFTLSGYLMAKGFVTKRYAPDRAGILRFYRNRVLRIVPLYVTAILVVGILCRPDIFQPTTPLALHKLLETVLFDDAEVPIGALWSICTEMQFYMLVPFLFVLLSGWKASPSHSIGVGAGIAIVFFAMKYPALRLGSMDAWHPYIYDALLPNLDAFLIGFLTAFLVERLWHAGQEIQHGLAIGGLIGAIIYIANAYFGAHTMISINGHMRGYYLTLAPSLNAVGAAAMIACFELMPVKRAKPAVVSHIGWALVSFFGTQSYALYVWHEPILYVVRRMVPAELSIQQTLEYLPIGLGLVALASVLSHKLIELPFDRLRYGKLTVDVPSVQVSG